MYYLTQWSDSNSITENKSISNSLTYLDKDISKKLSLTGNKYFNKRKIPLLTENKNQTNNKERLYLTDATDFFMEVLWQEGIDEEYVRLEVEEDFKLKKESLTNKYNRIRD